MATHIIPAVPPDLRELEIKRTELETLEVELTQGELELATLKGELLAFERHYLRIVGIRQAELDEIEAQVLEMLSRFSPEDSEAIEQARHARGQAQESAKATGFVRDLPEEREHFEPSVDLKQCYREIAKLIHPDLAIDDQERALRTLLMAEANLAYQKGDQAHLRRILLHWKHNPQSLKGEDAGAQLARIICRITQIKERLSAIQTETEEFNVSELYQLKIQVDEAALHGTDLLATMAEHLDHQVAEFRQRLADLVSMYSESLL